MFTHWSKENKEFRWRLRWGWRPIDILFGRAKHYSVAELLSQDTVIPMPEKAYPCRVVMKRETRKRPRLPWPSQRITRVYIDCPGGVPSPWDWGRSGECVDQAIFGFICPAETVEEGVAKFVQSVLRDRRRYGGSVNWRQESPQADSPARA